MARELYVAPPTFAQYISLGTIPHDDTLKALFIYWKKTRKKILAGKVKVKIKINPTTCQSKLSSILREIFVLSMPWLCSTFKLLPFSRNLSLWGRVTKSVYLMPSYTLFSCFIDHSSYLYLRKEKTLVHFRTLFWRLNWRWFILQENYSLRNLSFLTVLTL